MSERETIRGKIIEIDLQGKTVEEYAKQQLDCALPDWCDSYTDLLKDKEYSNNTPLIEYYDRLFKVVYQEDITYNSFCNIEKLEDGFSFTTSFYNGGTYLEEMIIEGLDDYYARI